MKQDLDLVVCDTSGRLHTNARLMEELAKCRRSLGKRLPGAPHQSLLVLDGTTGGLCTTGGPDSISDSLQAALHTQGNASGSRVCATSGLQRSQCTVWQLSSALLLPWTSPPVHWSCHAVCHQGCNVTSAPCAAGLNMLNQAREFNQHVPLDGLVLTKLDGTARGGAVIRCPRDTIHPPCALLRLTVADAPAA